MPPKKKQKTSTTSAKAAGESPEASNDAPAGSSTSESDPNQRDLASIPPHEYICIFRPFFDFENEDLVEGREEAFEAYKKEFDKQNKQKLYAWPAESVPGWKWIIQWKGFKMSQDWQRRASYCSPDRFGMTLYNDWEGAGLRELIENILILLNTSKKNSAEGMKDMWAIISGMGLWLNEQDMGPFIGNENGARICECYGLIGCAFLTALNALDLAGELKADSKFQDLTLVISHFLTWSNDLDSYGVKEEPGGDTYGEWFEDVDEEEKKKSGNFDWRKQVVAYAKKAGVDAKNGAFDTEKLLKKYDQDKDEKTPWEGRWRWDPRWKAYNKRHKPTVGGTHYDITKMTRKERAKAAYDGKDPLAGVSVKDIKEGNIMLG